MKNLNLTFIEGDLVMVFFKQYTVLATIFHIFNHTENQGVSILLDNNGLFNCFKDNDYVFKGNFEAFFIRPLPKNKIQANALRENIIYIKDLQYKEDILYIEDILKWG